MSKAGAIKKWASDWIVDRPVSTAQLAGKRLWRATDRNCAKIFAIEKLQAADDNCAKAVSLFQDRFKYRREVAGRGIDDLQYLSGRGLLLQRLARLGDEPRILHCDDRLRREILQQRYFLIGKG